MKEHKGLWFFLFGILFYEIIFPILDGIANTLLGYLQLVQGKQAVKMSEYKKKIQDLENEDEEPHHTVAMGFQISPNNEEWEEDDE